MIGGLIDCLAALSRLIEEWKALRAYERQRHVILNAAANKRVVPGRSMIPSVPA